MDLPALRNAAMASIPGLQRSLQLLGRHGVLPRRVYTRLQPIGEIRIAGPGEDSFRYCASAEDYFVRQVAWCDFRDWETATAQYIADGARDCGTFLDIGAHTGIYALLVATLSPETRVLAFEPEPRIFPALVANLELNGFANVSALQSRCRIATARLSSPSAPIGRRRASRTASPAHPSSW